MIPRIQKEQLTQKLKEHKLILLSGPKNAGKMELLQEVISELGWTAKTVDCHQKKTRSSIDANFTVLKSEAQVLVLNEAQHLESLQEILEAILANEITSTTVVACSFTPQVDEILLEALKMQGLEIVLYAPSFYESAQHFGLPQEEKLLEERLIYGNYPQVLEDLENAEHTLRELIQEVLYTKLGAADRINKGDKMMRVLQILAFQVGEAISYNEVAERCGLDNETVERYIDLLEQAFILIKLPSFHTEKRYELKKTHMIYFVDNGIRNALINNFNSTFLRNDMHELWRNYVIAERIKWIRMHNLEKGVYFWKTHTKQQMDFIEVDNGTIVSYKTDWEKRKKVKFPKLFETYYPQAKMSVLNRSTYWSFLTRKK